MDEFLKAYGLPVLLALATGLGALAVGRSDLYRWLNPMLRAGWLALALLVIGYGLGHVALFDAAIESLDAAGRHVLTTAARAVVPQPAMLWLFAPLIGFGFTEVLDTLAERNAHRVAEKKDE